MTNTDICKAQEDLLKWLIPYKGYWSLWDLRRGQICWGCCRETSNLYKCHVIARTHGGDNKDPNNFFLLCWRCHLEQPDGCSVLIQERWLRDRPHHNYELAEMLDRVKRLNSPHGLWVPPVSEQEEERYKAWCKTRGEAALGLVSKGFKLSAGIKNGLANVEALLKEDYRRFLRSNYA